MIVLDYQPLSIKENSGILEKVKFFFNEATSRKYLPSVLLADLYNETRFKVKKNEEFDENNCAGLSASINSGKLWIIGIFEKDESTL